MLPISSISARSLKPGATGAMMRCLRSSAETMGSAALMPLTPCNHRSAGPEPPVQTCQDRPFLSRIVSLLSIVTSDDRRQRRGLGHLLERAGRPPFVFVFAEFVAQLRNHFLGKAGRVVERHFLRHV